MNCSWKQYLQEQQTIRSFINLLAMTPLREVLPAILVALSLSCLLGVIGWFFYPFFVFLNYSFIFFGCFYASVIILQKYVRFRYKSPVNQPLQQTVLLHTQRLLHFPSTISMKQHKSHLFSPIHKHHLKWCTLKILQEDERTEAW